MNSKHWKENERKCVIFYFKQNFLHTMKKREKNVIKEFKRNTLHMKKLFRG